jgi:hypothetical protein
MKPDRLDEIERQAIMVKGLFPATDPVEILAAYTLEACAALRTPLPFHAAGERPEPYIEVLAIQKTDKGHMVLHGITGNEKNPELCHVDGIGEYDLTLNAEAYLYESDILSAFTLWETKEKV